MLKYIPCDLEIQSYSSTKSSKSHTLDLQYNNGLDVQFNCINLKSQPIKFTLFEENKTYEIAFENTFDAFKNCLENFIDGVNFKEVKITHSDMYRTINLIQLGLKNE